jgi:hypothetical protein
MARISSCVAARFCASAPITHMRITLWPASGATFSAT